MSAEQVALRLVQQTLNITKTSETSIVFTKIKLNCYKVRIFQKSLPKIARRHSPPAILKEAMLFIRVLLKEYCSFLTQSRHTKQTQSRSRNAQESTTARTAKEGPA